jgi:hypothetical protein
MAGIMQGMTAILRAKSTVLTAGLGNSLIATAQLVGSLLASLLTLAAPLAALALVVFFLWLTIHLVRSWIRGARFSEETRRSKQ